LNRVETAGYQQVAIIDGRVFNANQDLTRFGIARFRNLHESKTFLGFTVFRQLDGLHQRRPVRRLVAGPNGLLVCKLNQIDTGKAVSNLLCALAFVASIRMRPSHSGNFPSTPRLWATERRGPQSGFSRLVDHDCPGSLVEL
jgi:hypothetical protein